MCLIIVRSECQKGRGLKRCTCSPALPEMEEELSFWIENLNFKVIRTIQVGGAVLEVLLYQICHCCSL